MLVHRCCQTQCAKQPEYPGGISDLNPLFLHPITSWILISPPQCLTGTLWKMMLGVPLTYNPPPQGHRTNMQPSQAWRWSHQAGRELKVKQIQVLHLWEISWWYILMSAREPMMDWPVVGLVKRLHTSSGGDSGSSHCWDITTHQ